MFSFCLGTRVWEFKRKGRAIYRAGKNEMCLFLDLLVDNYAYIAGDAELLRLVVQNWKYRREILSQSETVILAVTWSLIMPFISRNRVISWSFDFCFKIIHAITSTFILRSSVMLKIHSVLKIQVVFLGSWEMHCCIWSPSMAVFPLVLD